jgi:hypothetical protein
METQGSSSIEIIANVGGHNLNDIFNADAKFAIFIVAGFIGQKHIFL